MNLSKKGWLREYLELKKKEFEAGQSLDLMDKGHHPDEALYGLIQPTGIMYGYPIKNLHIEDPDNQESRVKLLLMDTLISSYVLHERTIGDRHEDIDVLLPRAIEQIGWFYNKIYQDLHTSHTNLFGKKRSDYLVVEKILDKRIKSRKSTNFWDTFFHNSLLFLDIYFFRQWIQVGNEKSVVEFLVHQKDDLRVDVVKVMAAAAHANMVIEKEERKLFQYFIESLSLPAKRKKEAIEYFENGVSVVDIVLPNEDSWILKKYLLELAILTAWADRKVEDIEYQFLEEFNSRLGFNEIEFEKSMIAVEGFVLDYWAEIDKLQDKQDFQAVSDRFINRIENVVKKNQDRLLQEIKSNNSLYNYLVKAKTNELSEDEKIMITEDLIRCLESLPAFEIISLPRKFLSLNNLMKVIPQDFFVQVK